MRRHRLWGRMANEEGSALILALAFLALFGLFIAAVLSFTTTSERVSVSLASQRSSVYTSDGAVEGAINYVRGNVGLGVSGSGTPCDFTLPANVNGLAAVPVTCSPQAGSGALSGGGTPLNTPPKAILTLSTTEPGIVQASNSTLNVNGDVYSDSSINNTAANAVLAVNGNVSAVGACSGTINATTQTCNLGGSGVADPGYASALTSVPALTTAPASCSSWLVQFTPGYYNDASALSALTSGGSCAGKVVWFQPGNYYFNFTNSGSHVWAIADANLNVVGGTPKGWSTAAASRPAIPFPGGCATDQDPTPNDGVQFVFGGDSQVAATAGKVEVCAQPSTTNQEIGIYGLRSGSSTTLGPGTLASTASTTPAGEAGFTPAASALIIDGSSAAATANDPQVAGINLTGYNQFAIPAGSVINSATMKVVHGESPTSKTVKATITPGVGGSIAQSLPIHAATSEDDLNLVSLGLTNAAAYNGLSVKYEVAAKNHQTASASLDGISIVVTYTPPALIGENGCITAQPYGSAGTCALITTAGAKTSFAVEGTIYAPVAPLDISLTNVSYQVFTRGIISRVLHVSLTPASSCGGSPCPPTFSLPGGGPLTYAPRVVLFTAYPNGTSNPPTLRATVKLVDGQTAPRSNLSVSVLSWDVVR